MRIYFSHGLFFLFDTAERCPGNDWIDSHSVQGFSRRATAANINTLIEDGVLDVEPGSPEQLDTCERAIAVSVRSDSGVVAMGSVDPVDHVIWKGRPGWVRVTVGQKRVANERELRVFFVAEEAVKEEPTRIREHGEWLRRDFLETAEVARV